MIHVEGQWDTPHKGSSGSDGQFEQFDGENGALKWLLDQQFDWAEATVFEGDSPTAEAFRSRSHLKTIGGKPGLLKGDDDFMPLDIWDKPEFWTGKKGVKSGQ